MSLPPPAFVRLLATIALTSSAVTPLAAERWQDRVDNERIKTRLDLDGFERDGDLLTYRMEMAFKKTPSGAARTVISISVIDCRTNMRKHVATETHNPDRTVRKTAGANRWMKLKDGDFGAGVRNDYCRTAK